MNATPSTGLSIKKILVPIDFSELSLSALEYAAFLARTTDAEITLLHVHESYQTNTRLDLAIDFNEIIEKGIADKIEEIKLTNKNLWGVKIASRVVSGKIHQQIENTAKEQRIDLIVMGTHGVSGITNIGKYIIGSNAYRTIQNAPCPIITLKKKMKNTNFKDLLLPLDSTKKSLQKVDLAIEWAKLFGLTVHLVALTAFFEELFVEFKDIKKKVAQVELKLKRAGIPFTAKIIRNRKPSESVLLYAKKIKADIIFIATGNESQVNELLLGSAARTIVSESDIPVLSVSTADKF